jgi:hypothetical protein
MAALQRLRFPKASQAERKGRNGLGSLLSPRAVKVILRLLRQVGERPGIKPALNGVQQVTRLG